MSWASTNLRGRCGRTQTFRPPIRRPTRRRHDAGCPYCPSPRFRSQEQKPLLDALPADATDVAAVAPLSATARYQETLRRVDAEIEQHGDAMPAAWAGPSDADPTYQLIVACNELAMAIDDEIAKVHAFIKDKCARVDRDCTICAARMPNQMLVRAPGRLQLAAPTTKHAPDVRSQHTAALSRAGARAGTRSASRSSRASCWTR